MKGLSNPSSKPPTRKGGTSVLASGGGHCLGDQEVFDEGVALAVDGDSDGCVSIADNPVQLLGPGFWDKELLQVGAKPTVLAGSGNPGKAIIPGETIALHWLTFGFGTGAGQTKAGIVGLNLP